MFSESKQLKKKKKKDRTTLEATNSSLEDFVKLVMGRLILWHRQRLLKTPIKEKKNEKKTWKYKYI